MTLRTWLFEGTNGAALTRSMVVATDGTIPLAFGLNEGTVALTTSSTYSQSGTSLKLDHTGTPASAICRLPFPAANKQGAVRFYFRSVAPVASTIIATVRHSSTGGELFRIGLNPGGFIFLQASGGAVLGTSGAAINFNQMNRFEVVFAVDTASTGSIAIRAYTGESMTVGASLILSNTNLGTAAATSLEIGTPSSVLNPWIQYYDTASVNDGATSEIGPYAAANASPIADAGPDRVVQSYTTVTLAGAGSDSDGTIASGVWTQTGGSAVVLGGSGLTRSFTAAASISGETLTFSLVVTDNTGGTSSPDTMTVTVLPHLEWLKTGGSLVPIRRSA